MPAGRKVSRITRLWPLLLCAPLFMALFDWQRCGSPPGSPVPPSVAPEVRSAAGSAATAPPVRPTPPPKRSAAQSVSEERPRPSQTPAPTENCPPRASKDCHEGDVYWFDGCGRATALAEACDGRACLGISCAPEDDAVDGCDGVTAYGSCTGSLASSCVAKEVITVDCAANGQRCVMTEEGARCLQSRGALDCSADDTPVCAGNRLRHCVDGFFEEIDCGLRLGRCTDEGGRARCEVDAARAAHAAAAAIENCDGLDDDADGRVDEGQACDEIALVAFVPTGASLRDLAARMQRELAIVNRVFDPLVFTWAEVVEVDAALRSLQPDALGAAARRFAQFESLTLRKGWSAAAERTSATDDAALDFYIPVLFVETITSQPPMVGVSTLPNSRCGGVRISDRPAPPDGLVVVSERRRPETLAHELGHYLGLCHTHTELSQHAYASEFAAECERTGDGICDTAWDPGPERCAELPMCSILCADALARPDGSNVMSYYMGCRRGLSAEQMAEVEHNLGLRRGWFGCLNARDCPCVPGAANACPPEMSCQPAFGAAETYNCVLDGPALPGAACSGALQCSEGSLCLGRNAQDPGARCVRACTAEAPECACVDLGLPFGVCSEDMTGRSAPPFRR